MKKFIIISLGILLFTASCTVNEEQNKPNFILIMADDLGWGDVGFNGNTEINTSGLDKIASEGIVFDRFYSAAPVCSPTRGSCLTGRHPFRYGIYFANVGMLKPAEITLAELLKRKGYATGHFGKWHLGALTDSIADGRRGDAGTKFYSPPWEHGFDECFSTEQAVPTWNPMKNQKLKHKTRYWTGPGKYETENLDGDDSRVIMDRAIPFIKKAVKTNNPFFTVIWFHTPHEPVVAGPEYKKMYKNFNDDKQHYYGCITAMSEQMERLNRTLKKLGVHENTIVTFCSDNGPAGEGGGTLQHKGKRQQGETGGFRGRKGSLYEGGLRVPAFIVWPKKLKPGKRSEFPTVTSDYLPTILDILDIDLPDRPYDGISIMPVLKDELKERPGVIGFQSKNLKSVVSEQYKLIIRDTSIIELYDLKSDRFENNNIASSNMEVVHSLRTIMDEWVQSCIDSDREKDY